MMIRDNMRQALTIVVASLLLFATGAGVATAGDDDGFRLWVEPLDFWVLEKDQDTNSSKFQEYRDLQSGLYANLKAYGESEDGDRTLAIRMSAIGRDHARYNVDYGVAGSYKVNLDYNKIPHLFGNDATLLWNQTAVNRFELADSTQLALQEAVIAQRAGGGSVNFGFLEPLIRPFVDVANRTDLGLQRDRTRARFDFGNLGKFAWGFEYKHENRDGSRPMGAAFGFNNVQEIPEPINYNTTDVEFSGEFNGKKGGARFGYRNSQFKNTLDSVLWDNPWRATDSTNPIAYLGPNTTDAGPSRGLASLAPDNEANLLFFDGRARAGGWWFNGSLTMNTMTQNESLLPFTINTAIVGTDESTGRTFNAASSGLPVNAADTEVETMNVSANAGTELGDDFSLTLRYRTYDYDNSSPRVTFPGYVRLDAVWEPPALITVPYDWTKDNLGAELGWDATNSTHLTLGYFMESWDRTFREIHTSDEDTIKLTVDSRPNSKVSVRASWATGDRTTGEYDVEAQEVFFVHPEGINQQPGLRKFDEAERDVDDYDFSVQLFPRDSWNLSFGLSAREEDYPNSEFGLQSDEIMSYNFEFGYAPGAHLNCYVFGNMADREVFQRSRQSGATLSTNPLDNWSVLLDEDTTTWGFGLNSKNDNGWSWDAVLNISDSDGAGDFTTPSGGRTVVDIDNYEDIELTSLWVKAGYEITENASFGVFFYFEDYTIDSFILQGIVPYLPQSILLAPNDADYEAHMFGINLKLKI
ncbi:MAG: MtrB/PioB family decaheme-associated outer membrane protein [bacterium]|nr:MtrB/PioB family decaheme-associated outer membrane protein [bacterium]